MYETFLAQILVPKKINGHRTYQPIHGRPVAIPYVVEINYLKKIGLIAVDENVEYMFYLDQALIFFVLEFRTSKNKTCIFFQMPNGETC